jgi:hypothetical protein
MAKKIFQLTSQDLMATQIPDFNGEENGKIFF